MSLSPYPGLRPFQRDEADIFFGRDEQVQQLLFKLQNHRFLAVVGQSGCGKSSLIFTGLLNALDAGMLTDGGMHWRIANLHPGEHPMLNLARALVEEAGIWADSSQDVKAVGPGFNGRNAYRLAGTNSNPYQHDPAALLLSTLRRGPLGLIEALEEKPLPAGNNLLILVDQFEEIFRYRQHQDRDESDAFIALLLRTISENKFPVYVVITMRSDFLGDCALFTGLPEVLNDSQFLTPRLLREQRRMAIIGPAKVFGGDVEPALVNRMLNDMGADPDQLPVLQHALMRLWTTAIEREDKPVLLKLKDYEDLGGWDKILSNHADAAYNELTSNQQTIAEILFKSLSERSPEKRDTRRPVTLQTIADIADVEPEDVIPVINAFRHSDRSFLKPPLPQDLVPDTLIDISHESLIRQWQRMKEWVEQEAQSADTYRRLEQTALLQQNKRAGYLQGLEFHSAIQWKKLAKPSMAWASRYGQNYGLAMRFLETSEKREKLKNGGKILLIVLIVVTASMMTYLKIQADIERSKAGSMRLLAEADRERIQDPAMYPDSALLAIEAEKIYPVANLSLNSFLIDSIDMLAIPQAALQYEAEVSKAIYSPDGKWVATIGREKSARLWKTAADIENFRLGHDERVTFLSFSPDGQLLASASKDKTARLWRVNNGKEINRLRHDGSVNALGFSPDGKLLATTCTDNNVRVWDVASGKEIRRLRHEAYVSAVGFSPDGKLLVTAGNDNKAHLWDVSSGRQVKSMSHEDSVTEIRFSPDGKLLATASGDRSAWLWDIASGKMLKHYRHDYFITDLGFSPDGKLFATANDDYSVRLWDVTKDKEPMRLDHNNSVTAIQFSPDGKRLATASFDYTARVWDVASGREIKRVIHQNTVNSVSFSPSGQQLLTASDDKTARLWDIDRGNEFNNLELEGGAKIIGFSPDGQLFASQNDSNSVQLREMSTGKVIREINFDSSAKSLGVGPNGQQLATYGNDNSVRIWEFTSGKQIKHLDHATSVTVIRFSPDGKWLATISTDNSVRIWDIASGNELVRFKHDDPVHDINFSPGGEQLASASADGTARLWNVSNSNEVARMKHGEAVSSVNFSPDGDKLVTASLDGTARLWNVADGKEIKRFNHESPVVAIKFSPDGKWLVSNSEDKRVRLWDAKSGVEIQRIDQDISVEDMVFSPDSKFILTTDYDDTLRSWSWHPKDLVKQLCGRLLYNIGWEEWHHQFEGQRYRKTCPNLSVKPNFTQTGRKLVKVGKIDKALQMISELNAAYPDLRLNPDVEIKKYKAPKLIEDAKALLEKNQIKTAAEIYYQVAKIDDTIILPNDWNDLCWQGTIQQSASLVLPACDYAVAQARDDDLWEFRDSRGVARALTENYKGAIEDFEFLIKESGDKELSKQRQEWVYALKAGQTLFTNETLQSLKNK